LAADEYHFDQHDAARHTFTLQEPALAEKKELSYY
jgi:hypothetical protein